MPDMLRRWQALIAIMALAAATVLAPQPACATPATSMRAAMACCKTMAQCATFGHGHECCRKVQGQHEVPGAAAVAIPSSTTPVQSRICASHAQLVLNGEPSAALIAVSLTREAIARTSASPPPQSVPTHVLLATFLI
ncbi:MAG TPA: hypothetical protein VIC33_13495 [Vicinamibacterales bacterium]|jgi:hypothetical protein